MKKAKLLFGLTIPALCITLASCSGNKKTSTKQADLFWAYSTENLLSDYNYKEATDEDGEEIEENAQYVERNNTLVFDCLKGENEGRQLMIHAKKNINNFDFVLPNELKSEDGNAIPGTAFSVSAAYYLECFGTNEKNALNGFYPDALIPLENFKFRRFNHIDKDRNQSLYFNLLTTPDMKAGTYKGNGKLILDKKEYNIPFVVTIYDATLTEENHFQRSYLIWYEQIASGELKNYGTDMDDKYYEFLASKRIAPDGLPDRYESSPAAFAKAYYEKVANNVGISAYRFPVHGSNFSSANIELYMNALIDKNLELRATGDKKTDLFKKLYFYVDDEPTAEAYPRVKSHDKAIYDCKVKLCGRLSAYPDLYDSFIHIKNLVTCEFNEELVATPTTGGVQTWCPQFQKFQSKENREIYKQRMVSNARIGGENVFWYGCTDPQSPYPSFHLDADLLNSRILSYMEFDYGIQGNIFWCVNYYSKYSKGITGGRDIWYDPISWDKCAGDGMLVYPGVEFGIYGPITTLRLESIQATSEEYEYMWMIDQGVKAYNEANDLTGDEAYNTVDLLQKYFNKLFTNVIATTNDDDFEDVRLSMLKIVEAFAKSPSDGMSLLIKK